MIRNLKMPGYPTEAEMKGYCSATSCARFIRKGVDADFIHRNFNPVAYYRVGKFYKITEYYNLSEIEKFLETTEGKETLQSYKEFKKKQKNNTLIKIYR